ncbi:hypothetical protein AM588_10005004 [Phytophthora nicotianae]|uniref:Uncharacterized protein n=1 Tax=Phytophthora nicotianae TaxID=4792 RepID=A0A0W8DER7_PHYNI|nr:hypothetical protein AM588_10005004 [Phytophthora nicotianae]
MARRPRWEPRCFGSRSSDKRTVILPASDSTEIM